MCWEVSTTSVNHHCELKSGERAQSCQIVTFWLLLIRRLVIFGVLEDQADPLVQWQRSVHACSRAQMQILKTFSRIFAKISFKCRAEPWPGHLSVWIRESIIGRLWARYKFHLNFREIYIKALYQVGAGAANAIIFQRVLESVFSEMQIVHRWILRLPSNFGKKKKLPRLRIFLSVVSLLTARTTRDNLQPTPPDLHNHHVLWKRIVYPAQVTSHSFPTCELRAITKAAASNYYV